jgi:hypothetical protein
VITDRQRLESRLDAARYKLKDAQKALDIAERGYGEALRALESLTTETEGDG